MKAWFVSGLLIAGLLHSPPKQQDNPQTNQSDGKSLYNPSPKLTARLAPESVASFSETEPYSATKEDAANGETDQPTWSENIFSPLVATWALVVVAIGGIIVAICTLDTIREQTEATRIAAEASRKSADALINIERAWLMIETLFPEGKDFWGVIQDAAFNTNVRPTSIVINFKNYGHTPAWLIQSDFRLIESKIGESEFSPVYSKNAASPHGEPIPPGIEGMPVMVSLEPYPRKISPADLSRIGDGHSSLYLYGFLKYRDVFSGRDEKLRETNFCLRYECVSNSQNKIVSGVWRPAGVSGANDYT